MSPPSDCAEQFRVAPAESGTRLDVLLCRRLNLSRSESITLIRNGSVRLDGEPVAQNSKGCAVYRGQVVCVGPWQRRGAAIIIAQPRLQLPVLAEGDGYVVVDKPAGMAVHPLQEDEQDTVLNAVAGLRPEVQGVGEGGLRSGVVHRLDVDTSGALVVATNEQTWKKLRAAIRSKAAHKLYRAVVGGVMQGSRSEVMQLMVGRHRPAKVRVVTGSPRHAKSARRCTLSWRCLECFDAVSLLQVRLGTGFLHQIRAMLAHLGHPVIGDPIYGPEALQQKSSVTAARLMLHASKLQVGRVCACSPDPSEFAQRLNRLRRHGRSC